MQNLRFSWNAVNQERIQLMYIILNMSNSASQRCE